MEPFLKSRFSKAKRRPSHAGAFLVLLLTGLLLLVQAEDSGCDGNLTGSDGIMDSTGYPETYPAGQNCLWHIAPDGAVNAVTLCVLEFHTRNNGNNPDDDTEALLVYTSEPSNDTNPSVRITSKGTVSTNSGEVWLRFQSINTTTRKEQVSPTSADIFRFRVAFSVDGSCPVTTGDVDTSSLPPSTSGIKLQSAADFHTPSHLQEIESLSSHDEIVTSSWESTTGKTVQGKPDDEIVTSSWESTTDETVQDEPDDDDSASKIAAGITVPILFAAILLSLGYWCYRKKYPVRMIMGRDFGKFSNPQYSSPSRGHSLVREDADRFFHEVQPSGPITFIAGGINEELKVEYVNVAFQFDTHDADEEEVERHFRERKAYLFKSMEEDEASQQKQMRSNARRQSGKKVRLQINGEVQQAHDNLAYLSDSEADGTTTGNRYRKESDSGSSSSYCSSASDKGEKAETSSSVSESSVNQYSKERAFTFPAEKEYDSGMTVEEFLQTNRPKDKNQDDVTSIEERPERYDMRRELHPPGTSPDLSTSTPPITVREFLQKAREKRTLSDVDVVRVRSGSLNSSDTKKAAARRAQSAEDIRKEPLESPLENFRNKIIFRQQGSSSQGDQHLTRDPNDPVHLPDNILPCSESSNNLDSEALLIVSMNGDGMDIPDSSLVDLSPRDIQLGQSCENDSPQTSDSEVDSDDSDLSLCREFVSSGSVKADSYVLADNSSIPARSHDKIAVSLTDMTLKDNSTEDTTGNVAWYSSQLSESSHSTDSDSSMKVNVTEDTKWDVSDDMEPHDDNDTVVDDNETGFNDISSESSKVQPRSSDEALSNESFQWISQNEQTILTAGKEPREASIKTSGSSNTDSTPDNDVDFERSPLENFLGSEQAFDEAVSPTCEENPSSGSTKKAISIEGLKNLDYSDASSISSSISEREDLETIGDADFQHVQPDLSPTAVTNKRLTDEDSDSSSLERPQRALFSSPSEHSNVQLSNSPPRSAQKLRGLAALKTKTWMTQSSSESDNSSSEELTVDDIKEVLGVDEDISPDDSGTQLQLSTTTGRSEPKGVLILDEDDNEDIDV